MGSAYEWEDEQVGSQCTGETHRSDEYRRIHIFDTSWTELLVIAAVALIVIGPKDLPRALRTLGTRTAKVQSMTREFQQQFNEAVREAELDSIKKEIDDLSDIDPVVALKEPTSTQPEIRNGDEPSVAEDQGTEPARPAINADGREDMGASRLA